MFKKLKECKNLQEIFAMIGTRPFEITGFILLLLWCLLPIYWSGERLYWTIVAENPYQHSYAIISGHQYSMRVLGMVSLYVALFYLFSRLAVHGKDTWKKMNAEPWHFLLAFMLLWGCVSTLMAEDVTLAYEGDDYLAEGLRAYFFYGAAYVCAFMVNKSKLKWAVLNVFNVVANIVSATIIAVDYTEYEFLDLIFPAKLSGVFFHFNHAGYYINMGIVCAIGLYMHTNKRILRIWYALSIILQVFGILVNSTLGSFIGTCGALIMVMVFFVRKYRKVALRMITPFIIIIGLVLASYHGYVPTSSGEDMKVNLDLLLSNSKTVASDTENITDIGHGRGNLWIQSLKMIPAKPIFGYGPEHLDHEHSQKMWVNRPDNELIQHAVFMGIPAALLYLASLILLFIHQWKRMKQLDRGILVAAGCVVAYLISAMFGVSAFYTAPYLYIFWGMASGRTPEEQTQIEEGLLKLKQEVNETLEQRLLEPKKKKKRKDKKQEEESPEKADDVKDSAEENS